MSVHHGRQARWLGLSVLAALFLLLAVAGAAFADAPLGCAPPPRAPHAAITQPPNLGVAKQQLVAYRCTRYDADIAKVVRAARAWIERRAARVAKPALVLDIDETSLSNWSVIYHNDFAYFVDGACDLSARAACGEAAWERSAQAPAIQPTLDLFNAAKARGVAVFFVTGRRDTPDERAATEANLREAGYGGWAALAMRPLDSKEPSVVPFKTRARAAIEAQGYTILANVGDQQSDLANGHAERAFKLPDPFYYLP